MVAELQHPCFPCVNIMKEYYSMYKRQKNRDCGQSGEEETLWLMQSFSCHIVFSNKPTLPQTQVWTPLTHSATLTLAEPHFSSNSSSPHHNRSIKLSYSFASRWEQRLCQSACSYLFKLSEAVHLYRRAFVCLVTREICTDRKRTGQIKLLTPHASNTAAWSLHFKLWCCSYSTSIISGDASMCISTKREVRVRKRWSGWFGGQTQDFHSESGVPVLWETKSQSSVRTTTVKET